MPSTYTYNGHQYQATSAAMSWTAAETEAVALGGHLVTVNNAAENQWLSTTFSSLGHAWIGYSDAANEGTWVWADRSSSNYTNWNSGEPNDNEGIEDWAHLYPDGTWNDLPNTGVDTGIGLPLAPLYGIIEIATPGVTITPQNGTTTREDGIAADFSVQLNTAPVRDVTIHFTSSDTTEGRVAVRTLTFTAANWDRPQALRVTGVQDYENDGTVAYAVNAAIQTNDVNYTRVSVAPVLLTNAPDLTAAGLDRDIPLYLAETGGPTNDVFQGLDGADRLYGGFGQDDLSGGNGNDRLYGGYDDDFLYGEGGDDRLYGEQDDDRLEGGAGNDILDGGLGVDTLIGGPGNDTYYLGYDADDIIDDRGLATDVDTVIIPYLLTRYTLPTGIESGSLSRGSAPADLTGNAGNNRLTGNDGDNRLRLSRISRGRLS